MAEYRLTLRARRDILNIWQYIADDSVPHADRFIDQLMERFSMLGKNPYAGREREDIRPGIRGFPFREYEILYRIRDSGVHITAVVHGRRNLTKLPWQ